MRKLSKTFSLVFTLFFLPITYSTAGGLGGDNDATSSINNNIDLNRYVTSRSKSLPKPPTCSHNQKPTSPACWISDKYQPKLTRSQCQVLNGTWRHGCI